VRNDDRHRVLQLTLATQVVAVVMVAQQAATHWWSPHRRAYCWSLLVGVAGVKGCLRL